MSGNASIRPWLWLSAAAVVTTVGLIGLIDATRGRAGRGRPVELPRRCQPGRVTPPSAPGTAVLELDVPPDVLVQVDGAPVPARSRIAAGSRTLTAHRGERDALFLGLAVDPFRPVVVAAFADGVTLVPVVLGARCTSCSDALATEPALEPDAARPPADLDRAAAALARGDFRRAFAELGQVPLPVRREARVARLLASAWTLAGRPSRAPAAAIGPLSARATRLAAEERAVETEHWTAAWNRATERFRALGLAFAADAPALVGQASVRMDDLSKAFASAVNGDDVAGQATAFAAAAQLYAGTVEELAGLFPGDCGWQERIEPWRSEAR